MSLKQPQYQVLEPIFLRFLEHSHVFTEDLHRFSQGSITVQPSIHHPKADHRHGAGHEMPTEVQPRRLRTLGALGALGAAMRAMRSRARRFSGLRFIAGKLQEKFPAMFDYPERISKTILAKDGLSSRILF